MTIRKLPFLVSSQISSGETIFRPVSIVKELIENSLDAYSTKIKIYIEKGGLKKIFIADNGLGISRKELSIAIKKNTTSKISSLEDLKRITTLGFRGEALSNISRVSRFKLKSRVYSQNEGWELYFENKIISIKPIAHPIGTTLEVLDLFYNIPSRRNFLKSEQIEFFHIYKLIKNFALSRFDVSFLLYHNQNLICNYLVHHSKKKRLKEILGKEYIKYFLNINYKYKDFHIEGWTIDPKKSKKNNKENYLYVNKRIIKNKIINHAISRAYFEFHYNEKISYILYLTVHPREIDINIHPTKNEILFYNTTKIYNFIYQNIINAISEKKDFLLKKSNKKSNKIASFKKFKSLSLLESKKKCVTIKSNSKFIFKKVLTIFKKRFILVKGFENNLFLISINHVYKTLQEHEIKKKKKSMRILLVPLRILINDKERKLICEICDILNTIAFSIKIKKKEIILKKIPIYIYEQNIKVLISDLIIFFKKIIYFTFNKKKFLLIKWLIRYLIIKKSSWNLIEIKNILNKLEKNFPNLTFYPNSSLFQEININKLIDKLNN